MATVALARVALSVSATVRPLSMTTGVEAVSAPSVNEVVPALAVRVGRALAPPVVWKLSVVASVMPT